MLDKDKREEFKKKYFQKNIPDIGNTEMDTILDFLYSLCEKMIDSSTMRLEKKKKTSL